MKVHVVPVRRKRHHSRTPLLSIGMCNVTERVQALGKSYTLIAYISFS